MPTAWALIVHTLPSLFYFPATPKDFATGKGFVLADIADKPKALAVPQPQQIKGVRGIDPNVFIDKDGRVFVLVYRQIFWRQTK